MPARSSTKKVPSTRKKVEDPVPTQNETMYNTYPPYPYQKSSNPFTTILIILLVLLSFLSGYLLGNIKPLEKKESTSNTQATTQQQGGAQQQAPEVKLDQIQKIFTKDYIHFGEGNNKVLFVEISDPSCPYCHVADGLDSQAIPGDQFKYTSEGGQYTPPLPEMRKLVDSGQASYAMLYSTGHGNGRLAAEALYCAFENGKFWEVHDVMMTQQGYDLINNTIKNDRANSDQLAQFLGSAMDPSAMSACLKSAKYEKTLTRDEQLSPSIGFGGTPTFLVNTTLYNGAYDWKQMQPTVDAALK